MDFLKEWTLTISVTLIISIIFSVLTPKGNMGRYFKVILAMFIFVSFIYPVKNADFEFSFPEFDDSVITDSQSEAYKNIITENIGRLLEDGGYLSSVVNADISCSGSEIDMKKLEIGILDEFNKDEVKKYIAEKTGFNAEVYYLGE